MNIDKEDVAKKVDDFLYSDLADELVVAILKRSYESVVADLERLYKLELDGGAWTDYSELLTYARSVIFVLRWFTTNKYTEEVVKLNQYSLKIEELY